MISSYGKFSEGDEEMFCPFDQIDDWRRGSGNQVRFLRNLSQGIWHKSRSKITTICLSDKEIQDNLDLLLGLGKLSIEVLDIRNVKFENYDFLSVLFSQNPNLSQSLQELHFYDVVLYSLDFLQNFYQVKVINFSGIAVAHQSLIDPSLLNNLSSVISFSYQVSDCVKVDTGIDSYVFPLEILTSIKKLCVNSYLLSKLEDVSPYLSYEFLDIRFRFGSLSGDLGKYLSPHTRSLHLGTPCLDIDKSKQLPGIETLSIQMYVGDVDEFLHNVSILFPHCKNLSIGDTEIDTLVPLGSSSITKLSLDGCGPQQTKKTVNKAVDDAQCRYCIEEFLRLLKKQLHIVLNDRLVLPIIFTIIRDTSLREYPDVRSDDYVFDFLYKILQEVQTTGIAVSMPSIDDMGQRQRESFLWYVFSLLGVGVESIQFPGGIYDFDELIETIKYVYYSQCIKILMKEQAYTFIDMAEQDREGLKNQCKDGLNSFFALYKYRKDSQGQTERGLLENFLEYPLQHDIVTDIVQQWGDIGPLVGLLSAYASSENFEGINHFMMIIDSVVDGSFASEKYDHSVLSSLGLSINQREQWSDRNVMYSSFLSIENDFSGKYAQQKKFIDAFYSQGFIISYLQDFNTDMITGGLDLDIVRPQTFHLLEEKMMEGFVLSGEELSFFLSIMKQTLKKKNNINMKDLIRKITWLENYYDRNSLFGQQVANIISKFNDLDNKFANQKEDNVLRKNILTIISGDPHLLLQTGALVDQTSCQHYATGKENESLLGYISDANTKIALSYDVTTFLRHEDPTGQYGLLHSFEMGHYTVDEAKQQIVIGEKSYQLPRPVSRRVIKIGQKIFTKKSTIVAERLYSNDQGLGGQGLDDAIREYASMLGMGYAGIPGGESGNFAMPESQSFRGTYSDWTEGAVGVGFGYTVTLSEE